MKLYENRYFVTSEGLPSPSQYGELGSFSIEFYKVHLFQLQLLNKSI